MIFRYLHYLNLPPMKSLIFLLLALWLNVSQAQSIIGTWQLMKETTCMEENMEPLDEDMEKIKSDMSGMSSRTPQVIVFKDNGSGEESLRIIDTRKNAGKSSFLYRSDADNLYILDKKSRTIKGSYKIEELTSSSLILSNASRPCETRIFVRIK